MRFFRFNSIAHIRWHYRTSSWKLFRTFPEISSPNCQLPRLHLDVDSPPKSFNKRLCLDILKKKDRRFPKSGRHNPSQPNVPKIRMLTSQDCFYIIAVPPKHANVYYSVFFGGGGCIHYGEVNITPNQIQ